MQNFDNSSDFQDYIICGKAFNQMFSLSNLMMI